jgi:hypothetical protein
MRDQWGPFFVIEEKYGISGAQPAGVSKGALAQVRDELHPKPVQNVANCVWRGRRGRLQTARDTPMSCCLVVGRRSLVCSSGLQG